MKKSRNYGITLIALVVTIAILLILAGVTLQVLFNDGNILQIANDAVETTKKVQIQEKFNIEIANYRAEKIINPKLTREDFWQKLVQAGIISSPADITKVVEENKVVEANNRRVKTTLVAKFATTAPINLATQSTEQTITNQKETYTITTKDGYVATIEVDSSENITLKEVLTPTEAKTMADTPTPSAIMVTAPDWNATTHTATLTLITSSIYEIQWQKNGISGMWQKGTTVEGLRHGDTVFARVIDEEGNIVDEVSVSILDDIEPELATITNLPTSTTPGTTLTANVTHTDNQSKIDITKCKWLFNTTSTNLNVNSTDWNTAHTFSTSTNQITITVPTEPGNYYLHVLSVDIAGNKRENISSKVEVKQLATGITVNPTSATLFMGNTLTITPTVTPATTSNKNVIWTSSDPAVATVSGNGIVTPVKSGTVTITAKTTDGSNKTATCNIVVDPVAKINQTYYVTLQSAVDAVPTTNTLTTVELLKDVKEEINIIENKKITFKLNNHTISSEIVTIFNNGYILITEGTITSSNSVAIINNGITEVSGNPNISSTSKALPTIQNNSMSTLKVSGGTVTSSNNKAIDNKGIIEISGTANINSKLMMTINNHEGATLKITGGTIMSSNTYAIMNTSATTEISGNAYIKTSSDKYATIISQGAGILKISGGTIENTTGFYAISKPGGTIEITGGTIIGPREYC